MREKFISFGMFVVLLVVVAGFWHFNVEIPEDDEWWLDSPGIMSEDNYNKKMLAKHEQILHFNER